MHTAYNKFLVVSAIALLVGGVYTYFSNGLDASAATPVSPNSSLSSTSAKLPGAASSNSIDSTDSKILQDTAFLATLTSLTKIKIDTTLFSKASFEALNDNTVVLEAATPGRPNPFAIIDATTGGQMGDTTSLIATNQATQITDKSAVLNATINNPDAVVANAYFEYGPTPTLGKTTPSAKQSLIGNFVASITGLTPGTTYFFRAAAKIDGQVSYGEVTSFSTN